MRLSEDLKAERRHVEATLKGLVICERCGATIDTFADVCTADLSDLCPGFNAIDAAKSEYQRMKRERN